MPGGFECQQRSATKAQQFDVTLRIPDFHGYGSSIALGPSAQTGEAERECFAFTCAPRRSGSTQTSPSPNFVGGFAHIIHAKGCPAQKFTPAAQK
jgi:hypothetical protein